MALDDLDSQFGGSYTSSVGLGGGGGGGFGSTSQGESQSTSEPISVESRQTDWGLLQSQLLSMLGQQQYNWAMDQYAKGTGVTDQTIANFMEMSGKGKGLADTLLSQYKDQIAPLIDKYIADAGSYASEERQRFMAGEAMSTVGQADQAAMDEMGRKLGAFGVNVNSGRYMDSMLAARTADAAARAGAGTKAAMDTADRGRAMEEKAIAMGQQMPGQAVNAIQSAYAGLTGAENAILGLMNSGANLAQSAAPFFNAAVGANKVPPTGALSQQTSQQQAESRTPGPSPSGGGGGGGSKAAPKGGGEKGQQQPKQPQQPKGQGEKPEGEGKGGGKGPGGAGSADAKAMSGIGGKAGTGVYDRPTKTDEDPSAGTGVADLSGYSGPIGYVDPSGTVMPEYSPGLGRDAEGNFLTPETTDWGGAEQTSNWSLPNVGDRGYNVGDTGGVADEPSLAGANLGATWADALANPAPGSYDPYSSFDQGVFPGGDSGELPQGAGYTSGQGWGDQGFDPWGGQDFSQFDQFDQGTFPEYDPNQFGGGWDESGFTDDWANQVQDYYDQQGSGWDESGFEGTDWGSDYWGDQGGGVDESGFENTDWGNDYWDDQSYQGVDESGWDGSDLGNYDYGQDYSSYDEGVYGGGYDTSSYQGYDESGFGGEYSSGGGGYEDYSSFDEGVYGGEWAKGGPVRRPRRPGMRPRPRPPGQRGVMPTTGGPVPRSASPSRGRQTDDISARLNAGEYVIPKDVVAHQGTKFFTDLIAKSRKLRTGMAGAAPRPTMKRALPPGRPTFQSRPLPPR